MTNIIFTVLMVVCILFLQCHVDTYWQEMSAQWLLTGFISPTNTIDCTFFPLDIWWHVLSFIIAMKTHTSVKPAQLQVL